MSAIWTVAGRVIGAAAGAAIPLLILVAVLVLLAGPWNRKRKPPVR